MGKLTTVRVGMFELRQWTHEESQWVFGLRKEEFDKMQIWPSNSNRYDVRYLLDMPDLEYSEIVVQYGGATYPWFGRGGMQPLAAFPDYWSAKKFVTEYVEPQLLMKKMAGGWQ